MTLPRIRQVREVILVRRSENRRERLREVENVTRYLAGSIHAAAGNKRGVAAASKFRLMPREVKVASTERMERMMPADEALGGMYTDEDIARAVARNTAGA